MQRCSFSQVSSRAVCSSSLIFRLATNWTDHIASSYSLVLPLSQIECWTMHVRMSVASRDARSDGLSAGMPWKSASLGLRRLSVYVQLARVARSNAPFEESWGISLLFPPSVRRRKMRSDRHNMQLARSVAGRRYRLAVRCRRWTRIRSAHRRLFRTPRRRLTPIGLGAALLHLRPVRTPFLHMPTGRQCPRPSLAGLGNEWQTYRRHVSLRAKETPQRGQIKSRALRCICESSAEL